MNKHLNTVSLFFLISLLSSFAFGEQQLFAVANLSNIKRVILNKITANNGIEISECKTSTNVPKTSLPSPSSSGCKGRFKNNGNVVYSLTFNNDSQYTVTVKWLNEVYGIVVDSKCISGSCNENVHFSTWREFNFGSDDYFLIIQDGLHRASKTHSAKKL